jgi:hypothetical protein
MSNPWFRFYSAAIRHPKVARLPDNDFRLWVKLLAVACENNGFIPPLTDLKHVLNTRLDYLLTGIERLISALLVDRLEVGYTPHNWNKKKFISDTSTSRVTLHRKKMAVTETPPDTDTDTDTDKKRDMSVSNETRPKPKKSYEESFEKFWTQYPKDAGMSKQETGKAWDKLSGADQGLAVSAIPAFKTWITKQGKDYRTVHACRYLSQRRFEGFESIVSQAPSVNQVFVLEGSDAFKAWEAFKGKKLNAIESRNQGNKRGWYFPTEYPT